MPNLKSRLIKLARDYPEARPDILNLLMKEAGPPATLRTPKDPKYFKNLEINPPQEPTMGHKELLYSDQTFLYAKPGDRFKMHLNLGVKFKKFGMKTWSVKDMSGSKTIGHVYSAVLRDVRFVVRESGNAQVRGGGGKTVHAFCEGILVSVDLVGGSVGGFRGQEVKYNPHINMRQFCVEDATADPCDECGFHTEFTRPITEARSVFLSPQWKVYAKGAK